MKIVEAASERGPVPGWLNHVGTPNAPTDRYPVAPPPAIGAVVSATTFLSETGPKLGRRLGLEILLVVCIFLLGALLPGLAAAALTRSLVAGVAVAIASGLVGSVVTLWLLEGRIPVCSFIGTEGFARCTGTGRRVTVRLLRYREIADARIDKVHVTLAGAHVGTRYDFSFYDARGRTLLAFRALQGRSGPSTDTDESFFGLRAVDAWQRQRVPIAMRAIG